MLNLNYTRIKLANTKTTNQLTWMNGYQVSLVICVEEKRPGTSGGSIANDLQFKDILL